MTTLLMLQAYADGELDGDELVEAEQLLRESAHARAFVESLGVLTHAARAAVALDPIPDVDLTDAIFAKIEAAPPVARPAAAASSLAAARDRRAKRSQMVVVVGALAMAAAGILFLRGRSAEPGKAEMAQAGQDRGVEVSSIDSNDDSNVSVFYLPASGGNAASSVVVWIDDKGAP
jgi:hypothetical protein